MKGTVQRLGGSRRFANDRLSRERGADSKGPLQRPPPNQRTSAGDRPVGHITSDPIPQFPDSPPVTVLPPVFHMASPIAGTTGRPQHRVVADLRGDDLLLNERQQLLPFGQCQTQVGDIAETIGPIELHDVHADRWAIDPGSSQPRYTPHPRSPRRRRAGRSYRSRRHPPISGQSPSCMRTPPALALARRYPPQGHCFPLQIIAIWPVWGRKLPQPGDMFLWSSARR